MHIHGLNGSAKIVGWAAGIGAVLITSSIMAAASALWALNERMARLETKVAGIDMQLTVADRRAERWQQELEDRAAENRRAFKNQDKQE